MTVTLAQLGLFAAAFALAIASPGPVAAAIVARSVAFGFLPGAAMAVGAVLGDVAFALAAIFGLAALSVWFETGVIIIKYLGAAWLIWLGWRLLTAPAAAPDRLGRPSRGDLARAFTQGAVVNLGNPKAMLFYLAIFPGFFDAARLTTADAAAILAVIVSICVGGGLVWAALAARAGRAVTSAGAAARINKLSGGVLGAAGVAIAAS
ncbi:LysE family translocator [Rubrimonas cliftonensis]|uniref:Threonine/homoserine/homoserine lactone efflux protein n=1 Tax=Rubrimonas cliftonensis TaxID=89524 RepID=A0A1H3XBM1_9RHOB|nr:LysE family translocator [Rubrimonas cliftonensis]SDZ96723.1 Threonine/homoserine/homoserine lactone efflux protein [Rubrimonas cliftonensis]